MFKEREIRFLLTVILAVPLALQLSGCGEDEDSGVTAETGDPIELTQQGWWEFEDLNYTGAEDIFLRVIRIDPSYTDAYSGAGWSRYKQKEYDDAENVWTRGLDTSGDINDIRVGLGFLAFDREDYETCVDSSGWFIEALVSNPSYSFEHMAGIDSLDIQWTIAASHYLLGNFADSYSYVRILNPNFIIDLFNDQGGLNDDEVYALIREIERLEAIIRG